MISVIMIKYCYFHLNGQHLHFIRNGPGQRKRPDEILLSNGLISFLLNEHSAKPANYLLIQQFLLHQCGLLYQNRNGSLHPEALFL